MENRLNTSRSELVVRFYNFPAAPPPTPLPHPSSLSVFLVHDIASDSETAY